MEEFGTNIPKDDIYSKSVRAGKRTYFFDVKSTRSNELYLTITESKRRFNQQTGKFFYEKHKLFLYREDFDKFKDALAETYDAIDRLQGDILERDDRDSTKEISNDPGSVSESDTFAKETGLDEDPEDQEENNSDN